MWFCENTNRTTRERKGTAESVLQLAIWLCSWVGSLWECRRISDIPVIVLVVSSSFNPKGDQKPPTPPATENTAGSKEEQSCQKVACAHTTNPWKLAADKGKMVRYGGDLRFRKELFLSVTSERKEKTPGRLIILPGEEGLCSETKEKGRAAMILIQLH